VKARPSGCNFSPRPSSHPNLMRCSRIIVSTIVGHVLVGSQAFQLPCRYQCGPHGWRLGVRYWAPDPGTRRGNFTRPCNPLASLHFYNPVG